MGIASRIVSAIRDRRVISLFRKRWQYIRENQQIDVHAEVTSICNNKCYFCPIDKLDRKGFILPEVERRVVEFVASFPSMHFRLFFHLLGEPLLYKGLERFILAVRDLPNVETWLVTNGTLLNDQRLLSLHKAGLRKLSFSMFYLTEEDYQLNVKTKLFRQAWRNLQNLLSKCEMFDCIHIVTFSPDVSELMELVSGLPNVILEVKREVHEWRYDRKPLRRRLFFMLNRIHLQKKICINALGDVTYEWKDYNVEVSPGNVVRLSNQAILKGFFRSSLMIYLLRSKTI